MPAYEFCRYVPPGHSSMVQHTGWQMYRNELKRYLLGTAIASNCTPLETCFQSGGVYSEERHQHFLRSSVWLCHTDVGVVYGAAACPLI